MRIVNTLIAHDVWLERGSQTLGLRIVIGTSAHCVYLNCTSQMGQVRTVYTLTAHDAWLERGSQTLGLRIVIGTSAHCVYIKCTSQMGKERIVITLVTGRDRYACRL